MGYSLMPYRVYLNDIELNYGNNLVNKNVILEQSLQVQHNLDYAYPASEGWEGSYNIFNTFLDGKWNFKNYNKDAAKHWYV